MERIIFHCDLNSFYASVELLDHPELRHLPVAVCGDPESRHGIILAKNEPAKKFQVKTAETIWQAKRKCPDLVLLPAHHSVYREFSQKINRMYQDYTDLVEPFGIDESWLDVSGTLHLFGGDPVALADEIRRRMRQEFGLTISVGVSFNKIFAKLGSDYKKPDATTWISRDNYQRLVWPLPVTDLLYVGRSAAETLERVGVRTIGDLACGLDRSPVAPAGQYTPPKSVGNGNTFAHNLQSREEIQAGIVQLADQVGARLRRHRMKCTGVALQIRDPDFRDISRQKRLEVPTCLGREIAREAMELADGCWNMQKPVRALTVTAIYLIPEDQAAVQQTLFGDQGAEQRERLEKLAHAMDAIRDKYGKLAHAMDAIRDKYGRGAIGLASSPKETRERHAPPPGGNREE